LARFFVSTDDWRSIVFQQFLKTQCAARGRHELVIATYLRETPASTPNPGYGWLRSKVIEGYYQKQQKFRELISSSKERRLNLQFDKYTHS
jgi:hypothetical protein